MPGVQAGLYQRRTFCGPPFSSLLFSTAEGVSAAPAAGAAGSP